MKNVAILEKQETLTLEQSVVEQVPTYAKRIFPVAPFPKKYVLSMFVDLQDAKKAALSLRAAGFDERNIYILESRDFVEAVAQGQSFLDFLTSIDYDVYLDEASRGHSFVAVRPANSSQLNQIRDLLAPHRARLTKYIETWTITELLP